MLWSTSVWSQSLKRTLNANREAFREEMLQELKATDFSDPWINKVLWAIPAFNLYERGAEETFRALIGKYKTLEAQRRYHFLLAFYDRSDFLTGEQLSQMLDTEIDVKCRALIYACLFQRSLCPKIRDVGPYEKVLNTLVNETYYDRLQNNDIFKVLRLLNREQLNLVAFVDPDRNQIGSIQVLQKDGRLSENVYPFLFRAASNAPSCFTNGNTPTGFFKIRGTGNSDNPFIGPSTTIETYLIGEYPDDPDWQTIKDYDRLVPEHLRGNEMLYQAFYAGQLQRSEIIIHGSTIDPTFFRNTDFYPFTPSLGCMTAKEIWDPEAGNLLVSSQLDLIKATEVDGRPWGFLLIVNKELN
ncbi:hypothetical protein PEDI_39310 [Persicobacter diffluens]|uniref:Uncharacterized protein n=1 Tax=Persicobacter diffluens TaxID=981 RepID=A0AAN4W1Z1_9BACT|nr:hypothetical protein PEDI_39310 [Persicobacter diffluens]